LFQPGVSGTLIKDVGVLRVFIPISFHSKKVLTTTNNNYHGKFKKDEFTPILSDIIRMMVMTRLGLAKEENRPILAMNILTKIKAYQQKIACLC
jgi:hypothetical protein